MKRKKIKVYGYLDEESVQGITALKEQKSLSNFSASLRMVVKAGLATLKIK